MGGSSVASADGGSTSSSKRSVKRKSKHLTGSSGRSKKMKSSKVKTPSVVNDSGSESDKDKSEGEGEYVVEDILDKRKENGVWMYYIKWLGWKSDANTWEPKENLSGCEELLRKFEEEWVGKEKSVKDKDSGRRGSDETVVLAKSKKAPSVERISKPDKKKSDKSEREHSSNSSTPVRSVATPVSENKVRKSEKTEPEKEMKSKSKAGSSSSKETDKDMSYEDLDILDECPGGRVPSKLVGVVPISDVLVYCVEWEASEEGSEEFHEPVSLVRSEVFSAKFPAMVIKFYESHIIWAKDPKDEARFFKDPEQSPLSKPEPKKSKSNASNKSDEDSDDEPLIKSLSKKKNDSDNFDSDDSGHNSKENYP